MTELLSEQNAAHEYALFIDRYTYEAAIIPESAQLITVDAKIAPSEAASSYGHRSLTDILSMTRAVNDAHLDVFFFPSVYTYFPLLKRMPVLLGVHDAIDRAYPHLVFPNKFRHMLWSMKCWLGMRQADFLVTVSEYARRTIEERLKWPTDNIWVVGEAPDDTFRHMSPKSAILQTKAHLGLQDVNRFLLCVGGLNPHKNIPALLEAFAKLRQDEDFADVHLVLVGPTDDDNFAPGVGEALSAIQRLGLDNVAHLTGFLPDEQVAHLMNAASLYVMPSLEEGYGLGAVEAAACGTPIVATHHSPLPLLLQGGGLFVEPSAEELDDAIRTLLADDELRRTMGQQALSRSRRLTWRKAADQFRALLDHIESNA